MKNLLITKFNLIFAVEDPGKTSYKRCFIYLFSSHHPVVLELVKYSFGADCSCYSLAYLFSNFSHSVDEAIGDKYRPLSPCIHLEF